MGSLLMNNTLKRYVLTLLTVACILGPSLIWSAGYQEEKLFDGDFYSAEDLKKKIEIHTDEIRVLENRIKAFETDIDWLLLKINQIQDSGRSASYKLKESVSQKEKNINTLRTSKIRLEYLIQYYSASLKSSSDESLEDILTRKLPSLELKKTPVMQKEARIKVEEISPQTEVPLPPAFSPTVSSIPEVYNGISKTELQSAINASGLSDWVEVIGTGTCLRLETTLPILFPTGSADVATEYKSFFQKLAAFLKPYDVKILVTGYADTVPIHNKKYPSNFELGATRAVNVVHQLVGNGLKPAIFKIESTGEHRFAAKGMSKQKTLERRAEVTVIFSG